MIKKKFENAKSFKIPTRYDMDIEELYKLLEMTKTDTINAIHTAYKYGFTQGMTYKKKQNN